VHAGALALSSAAALAQDQPAAAPPVAPGAAALRLVFAPTGHPAPNLKLTIDGRAATHEAVSDANGIARISLDGGRLRIADAQSGLLLLATVPPRSAADVPVPLPVRISGSAIGFGAAARVRVGSGRSISPADFQRHATGQAGLEPGVDLDGMELPSINQDWTDLAVEPDGRFTSPWIAVWRAPQLAIAGPDGTLLRELPLPSDMAAARTIEIGEQRPQFSSVVEVSAEPTSLPHPLAIRAKSLKPLAERRDQTALDIALINALDIKLGLFLLGRGSLPLQANVPARLTVPPLASLDIVVQSVMPGVELLRSVAVQTAEHVSVRIARGEILGETASRAPLRGQARVAGTGPPAAGARVTYSSHPYRFTATTDSRGMFTIPDAFADRAAVLSIETEANRASIDHMLPTDPAHGSEQTNERVFAAPSPPAPPGTRANRLGASLVQKYPFCNGNYDQDTQYEEGPLGFVLDQNGDPLPDAVLSQDGDEKGVAIVNVFLPAIGMYTVGAQFTPYITASQSVAVQQQDQQLKAITLTPADLIDGQILNIISDKGFVPESAEVAFPSWVQSASPYFSQVMHPQSGLSAITMRCFNFVSHFGKLLGIPVYAEARGYGAFEGLVWKGTESIVLK